MDDITLPPLKTIGHDISCQMTVAMQDYARAAVIADRKRRAEPEPKRAYKAVIYLAHDGLARVIDGGYPIAARPTINWTNKGSAWIESADHRGVASDLRRATMWLRSQDAHVFAAACARAADLLDGGEQ